MSDIRKWEDFAANPEAFGKSEKELWVKLEPILQRLFDELKANGKIETVYVASELDDLGVVLRSLENCSRNHNLLLKTFENHEAFLQTNKQFGFEENFLVQLYIEIAVLTTILSTEVFRIMILFHSKEFNAGLTLWRLLKRLNCKDAAPSSTPRLIPFMDIEFRNALAHGLFGDLNQQVILYKNAKFDILDKMNLEDFMVRSKKQNLVTQCLVNVIAKKKRTGFFT